MPMPAPRTGETREAYVSRFMAHAGMRNEYPSEKQRAAVANSQWKGSHPNAKGIGMHIVGPANPDPASELDSMDAKGQNTYKAWDTMRDHLVQLGKRMGMPVATQVKNRPDQDEDRAPKRLRKIGPAGVGVRVSTKKAGNADFALPAPATRGSDQDIDTRVHDFVDDILEPPYPPDILASLYENSGALRRNVDAMATNVDGFGWRLEPVLDFSHPEVANHIKDLMLCSKLREQHADLDVMDADAMLALEPTPEQVEKLAYLWKRVAMAEKHSLVNRLDFLNPTMPLVDLRKAKTEGYELFGNAGWEIIRENPLDTTSPVIQVYNVPWASMRLIRADRRPTVVKQIIRKDAVTYEQIDVHRIFRRYVRITGINRTYYKEMGDPRTVSRHTGRYYKNIDDLRYNEGPNAQPANELLHWSIRSQLSPYGIPRWIGALLAVLGNRAAEEVNFLYFDNKAIPPMVLLVSGGRVSESTVERLESYIQERIKGRENFHKIMVIEGLPAMAQESSGDLESSGKLRLELKPLTGDMIQDALFQNYDAANEMKIGRAFRQPSIMTGETKDMNRSTADTAKAIAEEQIYQPARDEFDAVMDRLFLPNWKVRFWRFRSNAPTQRIPMDLVSMVSQALAAGAITPNEARALLGPAFAKELQHRTENWAQIPPQLAIAAARMGGMGGAEPTGGAPSPSDAEDSDGGDTGDAGDAGGTSSSGEAQAKQAIRKDATMLRGQTSVDAGHKHEFVAVRSRDNERIHILSLPAGDSPHTHPPAEMPYQPGTWFSVQLEPSTPDSHTHTVGFKVPYSPLTLKAKRAAVALGMFRNLIEDEVKAAKDDFFDPKTWQRQDD